MSASPSLDRWLYGSALALALVGGGYALWGAAGPTPAPPSAPAPATQATAAPRAGAPNASVTFADAGPSPVDRPRFVPALPEVPDLATQLPPPPQTRAPDPRMTELGAEMRFLSRAQELLAEHPAEALGVLSQHQQRFPNGVLREERDAFAIDALLRLEHVDEAERRYYDFVADYPQSAFQSRLQEAMQRPPHRVGAVGR